MKKILMCLMSLCVLNIAFASGEDSGSSVNNTNTVNGNNTNTNNVTGTNTNTNSNANTINNDNTNNNSNKNSNANNNLNRNNNTANANGGSVTGSGNSTNRNTNRATATGGTANGGSGGSSNVNVNNSSTNNTPNIASSAIAPNIFHSGGVDSCMGSSSAAVQGLSLGIALGSTWTDNHCVALRASVRLNELGLKKTAMARLCAIPEISDAFKLSGEFDCGPEKK